MLFFGQTVEALLRHLTDTFKQEVPAEKKTSQNFLTRKQNVLFGLDL